MSWLTHKCSCQYGLCKWQPCTYVYKCTCYVYTRVFIYVQPNWQCSKNFWKPRNTTSCVWFLLLEYPILLELSTNRDFLLIIYIFLFKKLDHLENSDKNYVNNLIKVRKHIYVLTKFRKNVLSQKIKKYC